MAWVVGLRRPSEGVLDIVDTRLLLVVRRKATVLFGGASDLSLASMVDGRAWRRDVPLGFLSAGVTLPLELCGR